MPTFPAVTLVSSGKLREVESAIEASLRGKPHAVRMAIVCLLARGHFTLPGGGVEAGETLHEAIIREVREETALAIEPLGLAGHREVIARAHDGKVARHFVILPFAARWISGDVVLNEELAEAHWLAPSELEGLATTDGLADIVRAAFVIAG
jgi:ADP-ribose pyrophosphatase YjhB (NUDIX family)